MTDAPNLGSNYQFKHPEGAHGAAGIPVSNRKYSNNVILNQDLDRVMFQDCVFEQIVFSGCFLNETIILNSELKKCVFHNCSMDETRFFQCRGDGIMINEECTLSNFVISDANLERVDIYTASNDGVIVNSTIDSLDFTGPGRQQEKLTISDCQIGRLQVPAAKWSHCSLVKIDLHLWKMENGHFERCNFVESKGNGIDFSKVSFELCNFYSSNLERAMFRKVPSTIFAECILVGADFREADASGALFSKVQAEQARFDRAQLQRAMFPKADLRKASFSGASAAQSVWMKADLTDAVFDGVNARQGIFRNTVMTGANVMGAQLVEADVHGVEGDLGGANLAGARGTVEWRAEREAQVRDMQKKFDEPDMNPGLRS